MVNPYLPSGLFHPYQLGESISKLGVWGVLFHFCLIFDKNFMLANSVDSDQMPRSAASDLSLHCLPMSQKWDARLIWVKKVQKKQR